MGLVDAARSAAIYAAMKPGIEASGGSAGNTVAGVASLGGKAAYMGKVKDDALGRVFIHDMRNGGVAFDTPPATDGEPTGVSMINVTPDGQRTMATFLGAANTLTEADIDAARVKASALVYLEGYLFDPEAARAAFGKAAKIAHAAGRARARSPCRTPSWSAATGRRCSTSCRASTSCSPTRSRRWRCSRRATSTPPPRRWASG